MSRLGTTNFTDCTAVRHKSLNKSVSTHGHGLSDVAYSKHFYTLRSHLWPVHVTRDHGPSTVTYKLPGI